MARLLFPAFILLVAVQNVFSQTKAFVAEHISSNRGLSHSVVLDIIQDRNGFLWIATGNGLNRYDGYHFTVFTHDETDTNSIVHAIVNKLLEDDDGNIWLATAGGIDMYNPSRETFVHFTGQLLTNENKTGVNVQNIYQDSEKNIWLSLSSGHIVCYSNCSKGIRKYDLLEGVGARRDIGGVTFFLEDEKNRMWIGTSMGGIFLLNKKNQDLRNYLIDPSDYGELNNITSIYRLSNDTFLTSGKFLYYFYPASGKFEKVDGFPYMNLLNILPIRKDLLWIPSSTENRIYFYDIQKNSSGEVNFEVSSGEFSPLTGFTAIHLDRRDVLWLGSLKNGLLKIDLNRKPFHKIILRSKDGRIQYMPGGILEDSRGRLWVSALNGILLCKEKNKADWVKYSYQGRNSDFRAWLYGNFVIHPYGKIWFSSFFWEIVAFYPDRVFAENKTPVFEKLSPKGSQDGKLSGWAPRKLAIDSNKHIWIAYYDAGLDEYDPIKNKVVKHYFHDPYNPQSLSSNTLWTVYAGKNNTIYVGTENSGFDVLDPARNGFRNYRMTDSCSTKGLLSNSVRCFLEDQTGCIWIGTSGGGVSCFVPETGEIKTWTKNDGISNNVVYGILEDKKGNIWLSTEGGITKIVREDGRIAVIRKYVKEDGIGGNEFNINSFFESSDGKFYFGGNHGITWFYPDSITENKVLTKPMITGLRLFNNPVRVGQVINGQVVLHQSITCTKELILNYKNRDISIEFTSDHFAMPEKNTFKYMLEGYDAGWKYTGFDRRYAAYTNLNAGIYFFRLIAINCDGYENPESVILKIRVLPPWYFTMPAFASYILLISGLLYLSYRIIRYRTEYKNKFLMEKIKREQEVEIARKTHELDKLKVNFFLKITHEFRTPLTLIISPVEKLMEQQKDENLLRLYAIIRRNANRLLTLINQLLDMGKIESGTMEVVYRNGDLIALANEVYNSFVPLALKHNIKFRFESNVQSFFTLFDADKIEKIITNLLSNAFKYTPEFGVVQLCINSYDNRFEIIVEDNGKGIPAEELPHIFERFYQGKESPVRRQGGTGIGLALVKELIEILNGTINVTSIPGETVFVVTLPLVKDQIVYEDHNESLFLHSENEQIDLADTTAETYEESDHGRLCALIVDDDEDMRWFLQKIMEPKYKILLASNGEEGLLLAIQHIPDIIISDILMPVMDGIAFCQKAKSDERISHIPFIFLTSRRAEKYQIEGLQTGAIDFVSKPFNANLLQKKIENILGMQQLLAKKASLSLPAEFIKLQREKADKVFLEKVIRIINDHIDDEKFDVDKLALEIGFGRTNLYKKLRALTGMTVSDFIRSIRLHEAARLLRFLNLNVNEVAWRTGFSDPSYFTKCFKNQFGVLPSDFVVQNKKG